MQFVSIVSLLMIEPLHSSHHLVKISFASISETLSAIRPTKDHIRVTIIFAGVPITYHDCDLCIFAALYYASNSFHAEKIHPFLNRLECIRNPLIKLRRGSRTDKPPYSLKHRLSLTFSLSSEGARYPSAALYCSFKFLRSFQHLLL